MTKRELNIPKNSGPKYSEGTLSKKGEKSLSEYRRGEIREVASQIQSTIEQPKFPAAISHSSYFKKTSTVGAPALPTTTSRSDRLAPEVYSPLFLLANLNLPRDRVTMNAWNRVFYDTHPIVRNAINLHASYPISKINITCKSKKVQQFFQEMAEEIDLYSIVYGVALEFWKNGEVFPYAELDREMGSWKRITILNPDYVHVKKEEIGDQTIVSLRPDAALQRLVNSNSTVDLALKKRLPQHIIDSVRRGQNIPLHNMNVSHLKLLSAPYDVRGTSIIVSIYKDIMLYDKLRESKFAQADGMINPLTVVKLGAGAGEGYKATQADIDAFASILEEAQYDKDYKLITHDGVTIEKVGSNGGIIDIAPDIEAINNNIYAGLMVPKAIMDQESVTYASSSVGLEVLRQRYDIFRNMIKKWLEKKIFAPICELQDFFEYTDGEKRLVVPNVDFNQMNLYDMKDYIDGISQFVTGKQISMQTLYRSLGLSYEEERKRIRQELIDTTILEKEAMALKSMRLSELLSLDPEMPINEPPEEEMEGGMGGEMEVLPGMDAGGGGGGGLDLSGLGGGGGGGGGAPDGGMPSSPTEAPPAPPGGGAPPTGAPE